MSNTHAIPDVLYEVMARDADLLSPGVLSSTIAVPGGGLTLAPFATIGYVRAGSPTRLAYVAQPAHSVVLSGADGNYWLALHADTHSAVVGWTRQAGTHYLWRSSVTQPADPPDGLVMAGMTVAGSGITAISSANFNANQVAFGASPYGGLDFDPLFRYDPLTTSLVVGSASVNPLFRLAVTGDTILNGAVGIGTVPTHLLHVGGSARMGDTGIGTTPQPGNALSVTGRVVVDGDVGIHTVPAYPLDVIGLSRLGNVGINALPTAGNALAVTGRVVVDGDVGIHTTPAYPLDVIGLSRLGNVGINALPTAGIALGVVGHVQVSGGNIGVHTAPNAGIVQSIHYEKNSGVHGLLLAQRGADAGSYAVLFTNIADAVVGSIQTDGVSTAYNTSSDGRLKHDVDDLTGELALVKLLRPVRFKWNADNSPGVGFLAQEVAAHVQGIISGEPDAIDANGGIVPQMIDMSKLTPWLVGAVKTLAAQVESLTARVAVLEDALGV